MSTRASLFSGIKLVRFALNITQRFFFFLFFFFLYFFYRASFQFLWLLIFADYTDSSDKKSNKDDKSKLDKNSLFEAPCDTEVTPKSELPVLPLNSNGLNQTAPHRIDLQKYVINPNRENCRRSSLANIPTANSSAQNIYVPQKEQQSKSLECSRTESEVRNI